MDETAKGLLIVEDSAIQREMLRRILKQAGYEPQAARDGAEGLKLALEHRPRLIVSDISMPNMDGYQMCQAIKRHPELRHCQVMLLTELSDPKEIIRGLAAGADNYLTKPYDEQDLLERIAQLLALPHHTGEMESGLAVSFAGEQHVVTSNRHQILNLLLSTYENAVRRNRELIKAQMDLRVLNERLEEKVLERTRQLEEANQAKSVFISNMSHELRT
ncbi:MAG: response regulator, partial [Magnetococcales bacterium]|nr:response regulator [Magnetococcales bacterium]